MADILIRGVQFPTMPQAYKTLIVSYDGKVYEGVYPQPIAKKKEPIAHAVELPEHGDLISKDDAMNAILGEPPEAHYPSWYASIVNEIPAIVPSNKED